jgi:hypothetical protein
MDIIESIKTKTLKQISENNINIGDDEKKQFVNSCYNINSKYFSIPIYYFFDHCINTSIGSLERIRTHIRKSFELDNMFSLITENIFEAKFSDHSTIFYYFEYNGQHYLYYSNSGLGIENQLSNDEITSCKIIHMENENNCKEIANSIINLINIVVTINDKYRYNNMQDKIKNVFLNNSKLCHLLKINEYIITQLYLFFYDSDNKYKSVPIEIKKQLLCYILINYYISQTNNYTNVFECTINHIINRDDEYYKRNIKKITYNNETHSPLNIGEIINNCINDYNKNIYSDILKHTSENINIHFYEIVNNFNNKIRTIELPSFKYKIKNSFFLEYNSNGLFNNIQKSGSCLFYSYYNLALNMKLLNVYKMDIPLDNKTNELVSVFINFHYIMMWLLCISNDIKYSPIKKFLYGSDDIISISYIEKIINENGLLPELLDIYKKYDTLLFNPNKIAIDQLLTTKFYEILTINDNKLIEKKSINLIDLNDFLDLIIFEIRKGEKNEEIIHKIIYELPIIFDEIIHKINDESLIFGFVDEKIELDSIVIYFNTLMEIYQINLLSLYELYINKSHDHNINMINIIWVFYPQYMKYENIQQLNNTCFCKQIINNPLTLYLNDYNQFPSIILHIDNDNLYLRFNLHEICNLSNIFETGDFHLNYLRSKYVIKLNYCKYIHLDNIEIEKIKNITSISYFLTNISPSNINIDNFFFLYKKCKVIVLNKNISLEIKHTYMQILSDIKILCYNLILNSNNIDIYFNELMYVITDTEYTFISNITNMLNNFIYYNQGSINSINSSITSKIYYMNFMIIDKNKYDSKLLSQYMLNIINKISIDNNINMIFNYLGNNDKIYNWINKIQFIYENGIFLHNGVEYYSINFSKHISLILLRFGISSIDTNNCIFLISKENYTKYESRTTDFFILDKCFILIMKYKKCIELSFNSDQTIDQKNCYIYEDYTNKHKLLLNLDKQKYPFISLIPRYCPYLCYQINNDYYLEIILSSKNIIRYNSTIKKENIFTIYKYKISPSLLFITLDTFDLEKHNFLYEYYDSKYIDFSSYDTILCEKREIVSYDFTTFNNMINNITIKLNEYINCTKCDAKKFKSALRSEIDNEHQTILLNEFLIDNRLCTEFKCNNECNIELKTNIEQLEIIKNSIIITISNLEINNLNNLNNYVLNNIDKWLLLMEINIIQNMLNLLSPTLNCWDVQYILTTLKPHVQRDHAPGRRRLDAEPEQEEGPHEDHQHLEELRAEQAHALISSPSRPRHP